MPPCPIALLAGLRKKKPSGKGAGSGYAGSSRRGERASI